MASKNWMCPAMTITIQEHLFMAGFKGATSKAQSAANTYGYFENL
jgi:hypothetical protein